MNEKLGDDVRYFRRNIAKFYKGIKDPYDPAYLQMDQYGNVLQGQNLEEHIMDSEIK